MAALYMAAAFGVLEASDILRETLRLPDGFLPSITVLVILGLPLALAIGWKFDITSSGVRRTEPDARLENRRWPAASLAAITALSLAAAGWTVRGIQATAGQAGAASDSLRHEPSAFDRSEFASIAVLPFLNLSGDPGNDYFGDGLAEEIGNVLSRIDGLRVAARTSAFAFKGRQVDAKAIGDTLGVGMLLEGSFQRAGERVRVGSQLIRTADGLSLWSNSWNRELTAANVFAIQDEITQSIASELERELSPDTVQLTERRTTDMEAYDLYLLGRQHWAARTPDDLSHAIRLFERAIERDSSYALAWAGLADAWEARPFFDRTVSMDEAASIARPAALTSLDLAPKLAEAHAAVGVILSDYDHDYVGAIDHLTRAVQLNPNSAQAWSWLCVANTMAGDPTAGLAACDRAVTLDPLAAVPRAQRALAMMALRRYAAAFAELRAADDLGPLTWVLSVAMRLELDRGEEIDEDLVRTGAALGLADPARMEIVADAIRAGSGQADAEATAVLRDLEAAGRIGFLELAPLYAWVGAREDALRVFERALERRDPWLPFAGPSTAFDPLRQEPAFVAAMDSLGISH